MKLSNDLHIPSELHPLLERHLHDHLHDDFYKVHESDPKSFLTWNRLDVAMKVLCLNLKSVHPQLYRDIYRNHIACFTNYQYAEPGDDYKNSFEKYIEVFEKIYSDISAHGFDSNKSIVPVSKTGSLLNGSHRVSASIVAGVPIRTVRIDYKNPLYDYRYFLSKGVSTKYLDLGLNELLRYNKNIRLALFWPSVAIEDSEIREYFDSVCYVKKIKLSNQGPINLIKCVYSTANWIYDSKGRSGPRYKMDHCFSSNRPLTVVFFESTSHEDDLSKKSKIRKHYAIGNHSVHFTDDHLESIVLGEMLLNQNSIHFLNHAVIKDVVIQKIQSIYGKISQSIDSTGRVILDGGSVLEAYGIRTTEDVDYLMAEPREPLRGYDDHESQLIFHDHKKNELIYDPDNYFYFLGVKMVSLGNVLKMKVNRCSHKDSEDVLMISHLSDIDNDRFNHITESVRILFIKIKMLMRKHARSFLKKLGLFGLAKQTYRFFKNKN